MTTEEQNKGEIKSKESVHKVLAHSYSVYFILLLIGIGLDLFFHFRIFSNSIVTSIGFIFIVFATALIFWAQKTGRDLRKFKEIKTEHFCRGPYCYTKIPTQLGLFLLMLGFGLITNSFFVVFFTIISFLISKFTFMNKHEKILTEKYGSAYMEYKKLVRF